MDGLFHPQISAGRSGRSSSLIKPLAIFRRFPKYLLQFHWNLRRFNRLKDHLSFSRHGESSSELGSVMI